MKKLSAEQVEDFFFELPHYKSNRPEQRNGQAMFNLLNTIAPDVAESVRGTENDPFYGDEKIGDFLLAILP